MERSNVYFRKLNVLAVCSILLFTLGASADEWDRSQGNRARMAIDQAASSDVSKEVRAVFSSMLYQATTDMDFDDFSEYLLKSDRDRIGSLGSEQLTNFKAAAHRFDVAWRAKYVTSFDLGDSSTQAQALNFPVSSSSNGDIAMLQIEESHGLPPVALTVEKEGLISKAYRVNLPDSMTAKGLADSLTAHLDSLCSSQVQWPQDRLEAGTIVGHHIALALMGK